MARCPEQAGRQNGCRQSRFTLLENLPITMMFITAYMHSRMAGLDGQEMEQLLERPEMQKG